VYLPARSVEISELTFASFAVHAAPRFGWRDWCAGRGDRFSTEVHDWHDRNKAASGRRPAVEV